jgi:hypothetical protein
MLTGGCCISYKLCSIAQGSRCSRTQRVYHSSCLCAQQFVHHNANAAGSSGLRHHVAESHALTMGTRQQPSQQPLATAMLVLARWIDPTPPLTASQWGLQGGMSRFHLGIDPASEACNQGGVWRTPDDRLQLLQAEAPLGGPSTDKFV